MSSPWVLLIWVMSSLLWPDTTSFKFLFFYFCVERYFRDFTKGYLCLNIFSKRLDVFINSLKINLKLENDFVYPLFKKRAIWLKRNYIYIHQASILLMNFLRQKCLLMKSLNYHHPLLLIIFHHLHISHKIYQKLCLSPIDKQIVIFYIYIYIYIFYWTTRIHIWLFLCIFYT